MIVWGPLGALKPPKATPQEVVWHLDLLGLQQILGPALEQHLYQHFQCREKNQNCIVLKLDLLLLDQVAHQVQQEVDPTHS